MTKKIATATTLKAKEAITSATITAFVEEVDETIDNEDVNWKKLLDSYRDDLHGVKMEIKCTDRTAVSHSILLPLLALGLMKCHALIDLGASIHATPLYHKLTNVCIVQPIVIHMADNSSIWSSLVGLLRVPIPHSVNPETGKVTQVSRIVLENIYYHSKLSFILISQAELCKKGMNFVYNEEGVKIYKDKLFLNIIAARDSLYVIDMQYIDVPKIAKTCVSSMIKSIMLFELHKLWGHVSYGYIKKFLEKEQGLMLYKITN